MLIDDLTRRRVVRDPWFRIADMELDALPDAASMGTWTTADGSFDGTVTVDDARAALHRGEHDPETVARNARLARSLLDAGDAADMARAVNDPRPGDPPSQRVAADLRRMQFRRNDR